MSAFSVAQGLALWVYFILWKAQDGTRQDFVQKDFWKWVGKSLLFASVIIIVVEVFKRLIS